MIIDEERMVYIVMFDFQIIITNGLRASLHGGRVPRLTGLPGQPGYPANRATEEG